MSKISYDVIGTRSAPATLTTAYSGNTTTRDCRYFPNLQLEILYTPLSGQSNRYALILVELSTDAGTTYIPISTKLNDTTEIEVYVEGDTSTTGIPITIPGDHTSTGGVVYKGIIPLGDIAADKVKISAREDGAANFGTLFVGLTLSNQDVD